MYPMGQSTNVVMRTVGLYMSPPLKGRICRSHRIPVKGIRTGLYIRSFDHDSCSNYKTWLGPNVHCFSTLWARSNMAGASDIVGFLTRPWRLF